MRLEKHTRVRRRVKEIYLSGSCDSSNNDKKINPVSLSLCIVPGTFSLFELAQYDPEFFILKFCKEINMSERMVSNKILCQRETRKRRKHSSERKERLLNREPFRSVRTGEYLWEHVWFNSWASTCNCTR